MEDKLPVDGNCKFYLVKKRRFCRFKPKPDQLYCPEHACIMGVSGDRKRIPCPLNPTHNCYEDDLEKHLKKCNVTKTKSAYEQSMYFKKSINRGVQPEPCEVECKKICVKDLTSSQLADMIERINNLYKAYVDKVEKVVYEHNCVRDEICESQNEDLKSAFGSQSALKKELLQQASLVGQLERLSLLTDRNCFVELGAGKGKLSHWIQKATKNCLCNSFVLVERSSVRYKMDSFHKQGGDESSFQRIKIDIEDLNLGCVPEVQNATSVIIVGKHLCGGATDMGLRCATNTLDLKPDGLIAGGGNQNLNDLFHLKNTAGDLIPKPDSHSASGKTKIDELCLSSKPQASKQTDNLTNPQCVEKSHDVKSVIATRSEESVEKDVLVNEVLDSEILEPPTKSPKLDHNKRQLQAIMIALCCHHQCTWETYSGQEFMQSIGISPENFDLLTRLSSWATCAKLTAKSVKEMGTKKQDENSSSEDHNALDLMNSDESKPLREQLSVCQREEIGRKCKRLIDTGRLHFLRSKGLQCFLREYIDENVTPENVVLIATSS